MTKTKRLKLRPDTIRVLLSLDGVAGGRITSIPTLCYLEVLAGKPKR